MFDGDIASIFFHVSRGSVVLYMVETFDIIASYRRPSLSFLSR